jgi:hypothetical protein
MRFQQCDTPIDQNPEVRGESRAFIFLETARLRCESLLDRFGHSDHLMAIHYEVGMAGYTTCAAFDAELRHLCLAQAVARLAKDRAARRVPEPQDTGRTLATMFSETIAASDALASELADRDVAESHRDRLHQVHGHVMSACELLDERLTVLELEGAGVQGG